MIRRTLLILLTFLLLTSFAGVLAQDAVSITVRCKASPPEEDWRCNNFAEVEEQVEMDLGIAIELNLIQDNAG